MQNQERSSPAERAAIDPALAASIAGAFEKYRPMIEAAVKGVSGWVEQLQPVLQEIRRRWIELHPGLLAIVEGMRNMPPVYRESLMRLGERGWYLDGEMALHEPVKLAKAIVDGRIEEAEVALEEHFTRRLDEIEAALVAAFPTRARILNSAFLAHRSGQYACSIPVMLTQIDGICVEVSAKHLFIRENKRPGVAAHVDQLSDNPLAAAMMAPLTEILPISAGPDARGPGFWQLNRHTVIHGESVDYDTHRNSLRAISLINYVGQMLTRPKPVSPLPQNTP